MLSAAERIREKLADADKGGYPQQGLFYVSRAEVEELLRSHDRLKRFVASVAQERAKGAE